MLLLGRKAMTNLDSILKRRLAAAAADRIIPSKMYFVFSYKGHHLQPSDSPLHYLRWENVIGTFELVFTTGPFNCTQVALS